MAAAAACVAGYKALIIKLDGGTESLLGGRKQLLPQQYVDIMTALSALIEPVALLPDWHLTAHDDVSEAAGRAVMKEHSKSLKYFATFVQAALNRMNIISQDPDSHSQNPATQDLFSLLFAPLLSFTLLPSSWPTGHHLLRNPPSTAHSTLWQPTF